MDCVWRVYCEELNRIAPMQDMAGTVARINRYIIIESILNFFSVIENLYALWQMMTLHLPFVFSIGMQLLLKEIPTSAVSSSTFKAVLQSIANWKHLQCEKIFPAC